VVEEGSVLAAGFGSVPASEKKLTIQDLLAFMEQDGHYRKSDLLYEFYLRLANKFEREARIDSDKDKEKSSASSSSSSASSSSLGSSSSGLLGSSSSRSSSSSAVSMILG